MVGGNTTKWQCPGKYQLGSCFLGHRIYFPSLILHLFQLGSSALLSTPYPSSKFLSMIMQPVCSYGLQIKPTDTNTILFFVKLKFYRSWTYEYIYARKKISGNIDAKLMVAGQRLGGMGLSRTLPTQLCVFLFVFFFMFFITFVNKNLLLKNILVRVILHPVD